MKRVDMLRMIIDLIEEKTVNNNMFENQCAYMGDAILAKIQESGRLMPFEPNDEYSQIEPEEEYF